MKRRLPNLILHADWSTDPKKRWVCRAVLDEGLYQIEAPSLVGDHTRLLGSVRSEVGGIGCAIIGFDFPIGIPNKYADMINVTSFKDFILRLGDDLSSEFYEVCSRADEISARRPFYPRKPGGTKQLHLLTALGMKSIDDLRRKCEMAYDGRKAACSLFWTLGANQVGRAAITGWRDVIAPALKQPNTPALWPVDGHFEDLIASGRIVLVETYPAEYYPWFFGGGVLGKTKLEVRKRLGPQLLAWVSGTDFVLSSALQTQVEEGFPVGGDDAFDATIGLFAMLELVCRRRPISEPEGRQLRAIEGWIFGQQDRRANSVTL